MGSEIASMDLVKMDFEKVDPWLWEKKFHQILNSLYWSVGSEIASMDLVKMYFEKVDPWFWEKKFPQILNSLNIGPWGLILLLWT